MYWLLALFVVLTLLAPGLLIVAGLGLLILLPAYLMFSSALTLVLAPQQILAIASDKRTRRAHACEHATVNVLEESLGPLPGVGGVATKGGFYIWGAEHIHPNALIRAAQLGLARMKQGERDLAVHGRCGTSMLAARFVFGMLFATGHVSLATVLLALVASWWLGRPLGLLVQRYFTTAPDVGGLAITHVAWTDRPHVGSAAVFAVPRGAYFFGVTQ